MKALPNNRKVSKTHCVPTEKCEKCDKFIPVQTSSRCATSFAMSLVAMKKFTLKCIHTPVLVCLPYGVSSISYLQICQQKSYSHATGFRNVYLYKL